HGTVRYCLCSDGLDGLGGLPHFRPACRDKVVATPHPGIDHPDADFDDGKSFQRNVACFATNEPRAEDADDAHANEQRRERDGAKASYLLEDSQSACLRLAPRSGFPFLRGQLPCSRTVRSEEHTSELQSLRHLV